MNVPQGAFGFTTRQKNLEAARIARAGKGQPWFLSSRRSRNFERSAT